MLVVMTTYEVEPDSLAVFRAALIRQAEITRMREVGCSRYDVSFDPKIATRSLAYCVFEDDEAYDHHVGTDHYRVFEDMIVERIESQRVEFWDLVATGRRTGIKEM